MEGNGMRRWARDTRYKAEEEEVSGSRTVTGIDSMIEQVVGK